MNIHATIEEWLDASFSMRSVRYQGNRRLVLHRTSCYYWTKVNSWHSYLYYCSWPHNSLFYPCVWSFLEWLQNTHKTLHVILLISFSPIYFLCIAERLDFTSFCFLVHRQMGWHSTLRVDAPCQDMWHKFWVPHVSVQVSIWKMKEITFVWGYKRPFTVWKCILSNVRRKQLCQLD
jgi:hypothetical protein